MFSWSVLATSGNDLGFVFLDNVFMVVHYCGVIMSTIVSQITSLTIVYSAVHSDLDQKKTSKLRVTGLCAGNSPWTGEFPEQMASNAENVSIWWRHHAIFFSNHCYTLEGSGSIRGFEASRDPVPLFYKYGLTTCLLHVGPSFGNRILNNSWAVGLT